MSSNRLNWDSLQNNTFDLGNGSLQMKNNMSDVTRSDDGDALSDAQFAEHFIYTYVILVIALFGIAGNVLNLVILTNKSMSKSMERMELSAHIGLVSLAVSDMLYCVSLLPKSIISACYPTISMGFVSYPRLNFILLYQAYSDGFINLFGMSSTWLTVTMAFSRYLAICHPFKARLLIGKRFAKISTSTVFILSVLFNIPRFLEHPVSHILHNGKKEYFLVIGVMNQSFTARYSIYMWCYFGLCIFLPFTILAFSNYHLIKEVRNAPKRIERRTSSKCPDGNSAAGNMQLLTLTLVLIVVFYIVFVTPSEVNKFINFLLKTSSNNYSSYNVAVAITNTMETFNFSFNFILYCAINSHFRRVIKEIICKKGTKASCCCRNRHHNEGVQCQYSLTEMTHRTILS